VSERFKEKIIELIACLTVMLFCAVYFIVYAMYFVMYSTLLFLGIVTTGICFVLGFLFAKRPAIFCGDPPNRFFVDYKRWPIFLGVKIIPLYLILLAIFVLTICGTILGVLEIYTLMIIWLWIGITLILISCFC
jgi:hypothetical protein